MRLEWSIPLPIFTPGTLDFTSTSLDQTVRLGIRLGQLLAAGDVICLSGELGAGKTAFASGIGKGWGAVELVNSPTFVFVHEHHREVDDLRLHHIDCYRLSDESDAETIGLEELLESNDIVLIEWPQRVMALLPPDRLWIQLDTVDEVKRQLTFQATGKRHNALLEEFRRNAFGG